MKDEAKFAPPTQQELVAIGSLLEQADITEDDVKAAISDWKNDPPIDGYQNILEAEPVGEP